MGGVVMSLYEIIETDEGLAVAEMQPGIAPEELAVSRGGVLVDEGPYQTYDEACDAMLAIQLEEAEDEDVLP
jgi:hypothetical protein